MSTKYVVVSILFAEGTLPDADLNPAMDAKVKEMTDAGRMVHGNVLTGSNPKIAGDRFEVLTTFTNSDPNAKMKFPLAPDFIKYVPVLSNHKYDIDYTNKTIHQSFPAGEEQKHLRIFPDQTSALEFIDYMLTIGALNARILDATEYSALFTLPDDSVLDQYCYAS